MHMRARAQSQVVLAKNYWAIAHMLISCVCVCVCAIATQLLDHLSFELLGSATITFACLLHTEKMTISCYTKNILSFCSVFFRHFGCCHFNVPVLLVRLVLGLSISCIGLIRFFFSSQRMNFAAVAFGCLWAVSYTWIHSHYLPS